MKRKFLALALAAGSAAVGCNPNIYSTPVTVGGGGNGPGGSTVGKTLPDMTENEVLLKAFEELVRFHREARYLITPPESGQTSKDGCLENVARDVGSNYMKTNARNCSWVASDATSALAWTATGLQEFRADAADNVMKGNFEFVAQRPNRGTPAYKFSVSRVGRVERHAAGAEEKPFEFEGRALIGKMEKVDEDYFDLTLKNQWRLNNGRLSIARGEGEMLGYFRPGKDAGAKALPLIFQIVPEATSEITFEGTGACLRPRGKFIWTKDPDSGKPVNTSVEARADGLLLPGNQLVKYANCAEFSAL